MFKIKRRKIDYEKEIKKDFMYVFGGCFMYKSCDSGKTGDSNCEKQGKY